MPAAPSIHTLLHPGDRRTTGQVPQVLRTLEQNPTLLPSLIHCLFDEQPTIRMRAADALEKFSRHHPERLQPHTATLLTLLETTGQQELQWHLAVILPRLRLTPAQRTRTANALQQCLAAKSSIARTHALQGLADLTTQHPSLKPLTLDLLQAAERTGTPAMRARSRKLLRLLLSADKTA